MPSTTQLWDVNIGTKPEGQIDDGAFPSSQFGSGTAFESYRHAVVTIEFVSSFYITSNAPRPFNLKKWARCTDSSAPGIRPGNLMLDPAAPRIGITKIVTT